MAKGTYTILLVDDDIQILNVVCMLLERVGYRVIAVDGGRKAIEQVKKIGHLIDLVLLDMSMPKMDGETTFFNIRALDPDLPILISSGYNENDQINTVMKSGSEGFIQKPYSLKELRPKIEQILSGKYSSII